MFCKHILICISILIFVKLIHCDKSFTIVLDTSWSMSEELDVIKANLASAVNPSHNTNIGNFILVPFSDPVVAEPIISQTFNELITAVNRVTLSRGGDCPELSLSGIEKALEVSKPYSNIFLFTDGYPKDINKIRSIKSLCRNTLSQVVIFLTGSCKNSPLSISQSYYDVATACAGTVFQLNAPDLRQAFKYIKELINVEWTDVNTFETFEEHKEFSFAVDSFTKNVLLVVSGASPRVELSRADNSSFTSEKIFVSRNIQVIQLPEASPGDYTANVRCQGTTSVILYKKFQLPLQIGFSSVQPRNMKETSRRPMPGRVNFILIDVLPDFKLESIAIQVFNEQGKNMLSLEEPIADHYLTKTFIDPDKSFRIWISGYDKVTTQKITTSTESLIPQMIVIDTRWIAPRAEILEGRSITVDYGGKATVACKVTAYPRPNVWWADDENTLSGITDSVLLEIPSRYINYYSIEKVTSNVTIYCKCQNSKGEDSQRIDVYVYRPFTFEVLQKPEDQSIEYGNEGKLFCAVSAYPEAEIKWYHNDTVIERSDDFEILPEENALLIKNMTLNSIGEYKCDISNSVNSASYTSSITISGIEAPSVEVDNSNISLVLGDKISLECRVIRGRPLPGITWKFKSMDSYDFSILPESVTEIDGKLNITEAKSEHNGVYRCYANNIKGEHTADIAITVQYPPIISNSETTELIVKEDDNVVLECNVSASPAAIVWWAMTQNKTMMPFDHRHHTDDHHVHRFRALGKDSGNYQCIAQNALGTVQKEIVLKVLVKPYIEAPKASTVTVRAGNSIDLPCKIIVGYPVPATKWQFTALDSTTSILQRDTSSTVLHLTDVRHSNEGRYTCFANNDVGTDRINIYVKVQ